MSDRKSSTALLEGIGERIRLIRKQRGMTQEALAGEDVTRNMLSRIEHGAALPSLPTLCGIADRLGVPVGALLGDLGDYSDWSFTRELTALYKACKLDRMIEVYESRRETALNDETAALMCEAYLGSAEASYDAGKLTAALKSIDSAKSIVYNAPDKYRLAAEERIYLLETLISSCPALYTNDTPVMPSEAKSKLCGIIFDNNGTAVYLYCLAKLDGLTHSAYSMPLDSAPSLCAELLPMIAGLSHRLYRTHIEAKLDLINADYLGAKAKLLTVLTPDPPPAILYDIYRDLEFCCKCCGDFENAYKYSGQRLELSKRLI